MPSVELLAPAGNWDCLKAAVSEGADAVYLGVGRFNARQRAENFKIDELREVVGYCHRSGVRVHLAANTLIKNGELPDYFKTVSEAYYAGVDAVIVQHLSFIPLIKESFPDMEVHASTQASVYNSYYAPLLDGVDRVVLPRELTLNQIREFRQKTGKDVEVFVQGALCFSISGQCLMSSFLGGRSGNRGLCAQPCRKRYNGGYLMSTRDLCLLERLPQIVEVGVRAIKIEGRLRSPEYVGAATSAYRRALDSIDEGVFKVDEDAAFDVMLSFNREFTTGGMFREYDVATPEESGKRGIYVGRLGKDGSIKLTVGVSVGDGLEIITKRGVHGDIIRKIQYGAAAPRTAGRGQTVRLFINAHEGDEIYLTSAAPRRKFHRFRSRKIIMLKRMRKRLNPPEVKPASLSESRLLVKSYSLEDALSALKAGAARAYYNIFAKDYPRGDLGVCPYVPRCLFEWSAQQAIEKMNVIKPQSVLCGDLGVASQIKGCEVRADISANVFNDFDVSFYNSLGIIPVVSPELTLTEMTSSKDKRFSVYAHGRIPLMSTKYALKADSLTDEMGYTFPVRAEADNRQVLNSVPYGLYDEILGLRDSGIVEYLLDLDGDAAGTVSQYKRILAGEHIKKPQGYTIGHFREGVE